MLERNACIRVDRASHFHNSELLFRVVAMAAKLVTRHAGRLYQFGLEAFYPIQWTDFAHSLGAGVLGKQLLLDTCEDRSFLPPDLYANGRKSFVFDDAGQNSNSKS